MSSYDRRPSGGSGRRESPPSRYSSRDRRSSGPSRDRSLSPKPRDDKELPEQFGRIPIEVKDDDLTVLHRMKKSFTNSPLGCIYKCIDGSRKLKVWTRNFKEVRGICTGYVVAFDKHWNLIMSDVDEVYLKPRKAKTPYLTEINSSEPLAELAPKVPKQKKDPATAADPEEPKAAEEKPPVEGAEKKKKRKKKKVGPTTEKRHIQQVFIRGDNIVMIAILEEEDAEMEGEGEPETEEAPKEN